MNDLIVDASFWLWDYYILTTLLLAALLMGGRFISQPARRMTLHWAAAAALFLLAVLCAIPGWSVLSMSEPQPQILSVDAEMESFTGPAIQWTKEPLLPEDFASTPLPSSSLPSSLSDLPVDGTSETTANTIASISMTFVDLGVISLYVLITGSIIALIWLLVGIWQVRQLCRSAQPAPQELKVLLSQLAQPRVRVPQLGVSNRLDVAAAVGLWRPMILLPESFLQQDDVENMHSVMAHEMAHVRNRDLWLLALLRGMLLLLWAHPLYWLWKRSIRLDQETLADLDAAEITSRSDYAAQLVTWARVASEARAPRWASSVGLWESPSQLKRRITVLLNEKLILLRRSSRRWRVGSAVLLVLLSLGLSLVTLQPAEQAVAEVDHEASNLEDSHASASDEVSPDPAKHLAELVAGYAAVFQEIEELHEAGAVGGEKNNYLLAKYHLLSARGKLHEAKQELPAALHEYKAALQVAEEYVPVAKAVYQSGRVDVETLLKAQDILAEAKITVTSLAHSSEINKTSNRHRAIRNKDSIKNGDQKFLVELEFLVENDIVRTLNPADLNRPTWLPDEFLVSEVFDIEPDNFLSRYKTPFDKRAGYENALNSVLEGFERDPYGPQINVQQDFLDGLTGLVYFLKEKKRQEGNNRETWLIAFETKYEELLSQTVNKVMRADPNVKLAGAVGGTVVWRFQDSDFCVGFACGQLFVTNQAALLNALLMFVAEDKGNGKAEGEQESAELEAAPGQFVDNHASASEDQQEDEGILAVDPAPGFATVGTWELVGLDEQPAENANTMTIVCRDEAGKPIAGATATLYRYSRIENKREKTIVKRTDDQGTVTFFDLLPAKDLAEAQRQRRENDFSPMQDPLCAVALQKSGYASSVQFSSPFQLYADGIRREVTLRPAQTLSGRVVNEEGEPVSGARVVVGTSAMIPIEGVNATRTDLEGQYALSSLSEFDSEVAAKDGMDQFVLFLAASDEAATSPRRSKPKYDPLSSAIYVSHPEYASAREIAGDIPGTYDVTLKRGAEITGRMVHAKDGRPAAGIPVWLEGRPRGPAREQDPRLQLLGPVSRTSKTDSEGNYRFSNMPIGFYTVTPLSNTTNIMKAPWISQGVTATLAKVGETVQAQDIVIGQGGQLRGQLIDGTTGEPLRFDEQGAELNVLFANIVLLPLRMSNARGVTCTSDGTFESRTPAGQFRIVLFTDALSQETEGTFEYTTSDDADRSGPIITVAEGEEIEVKIKVYPRQYVEESRKSNSQAFQFMHQGRHEKAIELFSKSIEKFPDSWTVYFSRASCYQRMGDHRAAMADFERILAMEPNEPMALNSLAYLIATTPEEKVRDGKRAVELARRALQIMRKLNTSSHGAAQALDTLAAGYAELGDFDRAIATQEEALELAYPGQEQTFREHLELYKVGKPLRMKHNKTKSQ